VAPWLHAYLHPPTRVFQHITSIFYIVRLAREELLAEGEVGGILPGSYDGLSEINRARIVDDGALVHSVLSWSLARLLGVSSQGANS